MTASQVVRGTSISKRVADLIISALVDLGTDTFFGVPGGPVAPIFDAIWTTPRARLIESRHETGAAFAAAGYQKSGGRVPCVVVTAGPGATNALTGVTAAHFERTPMIVISGDVSWAAKGGRLLQDSGPQGTNVEELFRGVTRMVIRINQPQSATAQVVSALKAATNLENPGPVLIVIAINQASSQAISPEIVLGSAIEPNLKADTAVVSQVLEKLLKAERPLIVFGAGCRSAKTFLETLTSVLKIPIITTPRAKGILNENHSCSLRHGGLAASMWAREYTRRGVDVALVLGTDLDDCSIGPTPYVREGGELIHVDLDARVFNRNLPTTLGIVADVQCFIVSLITLCRDNELPLKQEVLDIKAESAFDVATFAEDTKTTIAPYRALADLQRAWPSAMFVTDIGEHMLFALHYLTATDASKFTIHLGLGSMGSGICSSLGLALGARNSKVVCVCGDGGMQMNGMEVMVAKMQKLRILFAVFNDSRYNMVHHGFRQVFGREISVETPLIDFRDWGRSLGIPSERILHPGDITAALVDLLTAEGPAILDIRIDKDLRMAGGGRNEVLQQMSLTQT